MLLNGFELHVYNRSQLYSRLEHLFGLEPSIVPSGLEPYWQDSGGEGDTQTPIEKHDTITVPKYEWRDLIPVIKAEISTGRVVFGNRLLPTTLSVNFEEAHIIYTTKPAPSRLDQFTHITKCKAENFKVILAPSPKYTGLSDEPPRYMGEGFVVFQSNFVDLYYYQDEAGFVTAEPEMVELADGDVVQRSTAPLWGLDIKCGKGTDFSYGPWADRQREHLYKFFFPQDFQTLEVTKQAKVGERRFCESFDIRLSTLAEATIDILFSKEKETNAIHMNVGQGSYLEVTIPMRITEDGYISRINGQLLHLEASTSLQYRSLVESETLEFDVQVKYPRMWNDHQNWTCILTGCKATVHLIYAHKHFFHALMEDWASKSRPDILHFVPYTWHFSLILKEFELITVVNEYNWIDCSSQHQENTYLAVSGDQFELSFDLPFIEYLPPTVGLKFWIQGESVDMCMYLPEVNTNRDIILMLERCSKLTCRNGSPVVQDNNTKKWRNMAKTSAGWVDCWSVPIVALSIRYIYHPSPPCCHSGLDLDITTPEKEEILLSPIRPNGSQNRKKRSYSQCLEFDPMSMNPDTVHLELEIGPSVLKLYGSLLRNLINLKENYFGENQKFFEFDSPIITPDQVQSSTTDECDNKEFDPRVYRPLEVTVSVTMHDIQGHIMKCCSETDPPCPSLYLERFSFEMHKTYEETVLQLLLSPLILSTVDTVARPDCHAHLKDGHVAVSSLQVRGHAMFSGVDRPLGSETLEYAWLIEVLVGDITGRITVPQMYHTVTGLELFVFQVQQVDCDLQPPYAFKLCQHDIPQPNCSHTTASLVCPCPDDIKYRMTRLSVDALDICIVESGTAIEIEIFPLRLATCNLHGGDTLSGLSMLLQHVQFKQYAKISSNLVCSSVYSIVSHGLGSQQNSSSELWLEVGGFSFGPVYVDAASSQLKKDEVIQQDKFLKIHDAKRKKLWFLWPLDALTITQSVNGKCGCVGGCAFFGSNRNGVYFFCVNNHHEDVVSARYQIGTDNYLGYGESLLHRGHFVFDAPENAPILKTGYSPSHSEKSFIATDSSNALSSSKVNDTILSRSSDTDSQFVPRGHSAFSESFLDDKISFFSHNKITNENHLENAQCDTSITSFSREHRHSQVRCIKRQFSSPTHMSMPSSSSVLSSFQISMAQSAPVSGKHERKMMVKNDDWKNTFESSVSSAPVREGSVSPGLSQNRYSSRISLNTCPNGRGENNGSRHSLANIASRSYSPRSVRRAASTESTHSTESYFSADEDAISSLENGDSVTLDESHSEEEKRHVIIKNGTNSVDRKISATRRSLHDIQETPSQQSSDSDLHVTVLQRTPSCGNHHDPSDSNSISSTSFLSAMSSQEDIALVDLHNQMDKPIIESPLLMSCYMAHMTQLQCYQWVQPPPLPQFMHQSGSHHSGHCRDFIFNRMHSAWKPKFVPLTEGYTSIHMVDKSKVPGYRQKYCHVQKSVSTHSEEEFQPGLFHPEMKKDDCIGGDYSSKNSSKVVLVIKLSGDVHFMISPLFVESLRSFIDVLTPTLVQLHPLTIVNHLHVMCSHEVQKNNQLKKEKILHLSQLRAQIIEKYKKRNINEKNINGSSENLGNNYEETRTTQTRTLIKVNKVNISIMQASIVEEVIAFSALDNLKDLTCVSLLSICVDNTLIQLSHSCQAKKVIQTFTDYCSDNIARSKMNERSSKKAKTDSLPTELLTVETSETQQEETVLSASVTCIHCQLRRLKNNSSILKEAMLTVIPYYRSKVEFTFENCSFLGRQLSKQNEKQDTFMDSDWNQYLDEEKLGFIMFECGLEDIGVKFVKRWGYNSLPAIEGEEKKHVPKIPKENKLSTRKMYTTNEQPSPSRHSFKSGNCDDHWDTKMSFPSCVSECGSYSSSDGSKSNIHHQNLKGDASSFIIELKTVWFNFAAPPRTPNTRKIDFTRLDWHLLSTATPSINAWLKPSDRLLVSVRKMAKETAQRSAAAMACLMAEALEVQSIHMPIKSKYLSVKLSPLAKTLQEDPSCQLLMVLRRYLKQVNLEAVEENLSPEYIPQIKTLYRGLIALSRQWKNVLYMPFLVEQNIRFRKNMRPLNLSFSAPKIDAMLSNNEENDKLSLDECEVTDETTNLLIAEGGSLTVAQGQKVVPSQGTPPIKSYSSPDTGSRSSSSQQEITEEAVSSGSGPHKSRRKLPSYPPRTSRASVAFPLLGGPLDSPGRYAGGMNSKTNGFVLQQYGVNAISKLKRNDSRHSLKSTTWSLSSIEPNLQSSVFGTSQKGLVNGDMDQVDEDLYNWMARQQDYIRSTNNQKRIERAQMESKKSTFATENSFETEMPKSIAAAVNFAPLSIQLADAHVIFQPFLNSIGVPNQTHHTSFSAIFGPKISVSTAVEMLKIDIVESEYQSNARQKKKTNRKQSNMHGKFFIDTSMDTPTFICDKFSLEMELRETLHHKAESISNDILITAPALMFMTNDSRHSTVINFTVDINFVAQQVNMPLLRLLHQFSTMYENIKETRLELKANRLSSFKESVKNDKKGFSPSESQTGSYRLNSPRPPPAKFNTPTPTPTKSSSVGVASLTAGIRRPHTLSQRLRASTKGYTNLQEMTSKEERSSSPLSFTLSESVAIDIPDTCSAPASEHTLLGEIKDLHPRCWRTMFYLLDLYDTMPEPKTVNERCSAVHLPQDRKSPDISDEYKGNGKYEPLKEQHVDIDAPDNTNTVKPEKTTSPVIHKDHLKGFTKALIVRDWTPLIVFGVATVHKTRLLAMLSGLKLEGELNGFHSSLTHKERVRGTTRKWSESSLAGQLGQAMVVVLEGVPPNQQTVVKMTVGKSQALYSSQNKKGKDRNSALLTIGPINIDIPQHPVVLHGMMTRSSRQLSTTLQELRATRQPLRTSRQIDEYSASAANHSPQPPWDTPQNRLPDHGHELIRPIIIQFSIILDSLTIGAAVLPSLRAQYQMGQVTSMGVTGSKAKFTVDLPQHTLSFNTKIQPSEGNMPSSASVDLPLVHISAEYIQDPTSANTATNKLESFTDGVVLCQGSYLSALAEIGSFEHSLTTDLLNHLVLVQKVFMKEVNEVVQKMSGADKPVPLWGEQDKPSHMRPRRLLFSLLLRLKGIQITATTPTSSAVRLETGVVELQLSNRVQNMSSSGPYTGSYMKLFGKAQVDVNLALGQLIKNALFEEAEPEFQQFAYFKTRICMRNALQDEMISSQSEDKEAVLITLNRPLMYIQPIALDKAVLVWLNYKNAYEYWNEQRASLNKEVLTATQQVFERVPQISQLSSQALGTLFLQLTVDDMGICLPLNPYAGKKEGYKKNVSSKMYDTELKAAVVVTLESTRISACSCGSLVSKAKFTGLCIRFADDFETSLDDWKPDPTDSNIMNLCVVSEGTYEICSRTIAPQGLNNAKWILNVQWQMEGVDIHLDTNIGKQLSTLFKTLTAITGVEDEGDGMDYPDVGVDESTRHGPSVQEPVIARKGSTFVETLPPLFLDPSLDAKKRSRLIEKEMNEQAKIINDLRLLGASQSTIEQEVRRLHELETAVFNDFRRDVIKKLRRQSVKATSFKDKLGLGTRSAAGPLQSMSLFFPDTEENAEVGMSEIIQTPSSKDSSPSHAHTRTGSLDMSDLPNLTLPEKSVHRELSLDSVFTSSAAADLGYSETPTPSHNQECNGNTYKLEHSPCPADHTTSSESPASSSADAVLENTMKADTIDSKRLNDQQKTGHTTPGGASSGVSSFKQPPSEPNVDFELDVKVFFNSGKCVLHTKDFNKEEEFLKRSMRKERSFSGGGFDLSSPSHTKKRHGSGMRNNMSASRLRYVQTAPTNQVADFTIFLIPGLDVKVHYNSKTVSGDSPITSINGSSKYCSEAETGGFDSFSGRSSFLAVDPSQMSSCSLRKARIKKACLFAWVTLQSIPEEAVVSPHILDFLEQALEPIPIQLTKTAPVLETNKIEDEGASLVTPSQYAYASFPVDVIVYFLFSSKRAEDDLYATAVQDAGSTKSKGGFLKDGGNRTIFESASVCQTAVGGLSMTGCLADFSLYIFHPYGGAKKAGSTKEGETSPLSTSERKDSLSLQVEFVKVNISRSRKINFSMEPVMNFQKLGRAFDSGGALIRFSAICDIGSASFKYDMRRLTEILAFPKAWYRRSIARRMFLGDQSTGALYSDQEDSVETSSSSGTMSPSISKADYIAFSSPVNVQSSTSGLTTSTASESAPLSSTSARPSHNIKNIITSENIKESMKPMRPLISNHGHRDRLWLNLDRNVQESKRGVDIRSPSKSGSSSYDESKDSASSEHSSPLHSSRHNSSWETLVLFAVNLSRLNVHMNMGNVMGNTTWLTRDFKSQGRLSIGSSGHKNLFLSIGLEGSTLDSKGGIVGGTIELSRIDTCMHLKEEWGQEPDHTVALKLGALESRLDYMGTSVLMGRVSSLDITLKDEWRVSTVLNQDHISSHPTKRPALIFVNGELSWDQLQLLISKSTTPDLIKMYSKLEEFFSQQFHSSKRVFSSLQPRLQRHSLKNRSRKSKSSEETEAKHHRHWQKVLSMVSGLQLSTMTSALPDMGTILGGTMDLHGYNISLACFHGINFRSKAWAIFSMRKPTISFATEAQDVVKDDGSVATHIVQNLSYALGNSSTETAQHASMATVCRISRNVLFPPQFRSMHEWFHYAFATSELDDVGRFPVLEHDRESTSENRRVSMPSKGPEFNHNMEVIFALPSMQLHLKTEHLQPAKPISTGGPKPTVECSFVTEFDDHIFVAVDAEAFFFLHDLITSYIKEKEISTFGKSHSPDSDRKLKMADPTDSLQKDWRSYQCHTWHLEPTVRLLSWAGKGIEPYGVDYILQKLGFAHARVTIPKWMQRGCMDPLDKILAVVMEKMISAVRDDKDDGGVNVKKL
ncbi:Transmembrane protein KIAA1109 like protein [Argiope bruennichi]|uniref:Transmembrane protein KIAA1109 like protein n=1 Tax=Argiope bruennichi TaxID=94029 RepID=A0A8T0F184_ARGBR|nr:Transmembrane protein KIAA1109 like protein [Argiope bruennichi]